MTPNYEEDPCWRVSLAAARLREMGEAVTPQTVERELRRTTARMRLAEDDDYYAPPDPYAKALAALRQREAIEAATKRACPSAPQPAEMRFDANGIPDPYVHGLEKLRSGNR